MTDSVAPAFISDVHKAFDVNTQIVTVSCKFDVSLFHLSDYAALGLVMPEAIAASVRKRQAEFLAGRYVASLALAALGTDMRAFGSIGIGPGRNPVWPQGVVASISHTAGYAVCAASLRAHNDFLGVDIELLSPEMDDADVRQAVMTESELALLADAGLTPSLAVFLTFSAKESLFKALYPAVGDYFGFEVATVTGCNPQAGTLSLTLVAWFADKHQLPVQYQCRYWVEADGGPPMRIKTLLAGGYSIVA